MSFLQNSNTQCSSFIYLVRLVSDLYCAIQEFNHHRPFPFYGREYTFRPAKEIRRRQKIQSAKIATCSVKDHTRKSCALYSGWIFLLQKKKSFRVGLHHYRTPTYDRHFHLLFNIFRWKMEKKIPSHCIFSALASTQYDFSFNRMNSIVTRNIHIRHQSWFLQPFGLASNVPVLVDIDFNKRPSGVKSK